MNRQLTDTLVLRAAKTEHDVTRLITFTALVHSNTAAPDPRLGEVVRTMLAPGAHPTMTRDDFIFVEDTASGVVVSSMCLIPQTWTYAGIPFGVGRPELVGTLAEYRRQGLVRAQFEEAHQRCAALHLPVQAITGIAYFYRQFGYEYALELGGGWVIPLATLPKTPESVLSLRPATADDLPTLQAFYDSFTKRYLVACLRPAEHWRYLLGLSDGNIDKQWFYLIIRQGAVVGYVDILKETQADRARTTELAFNGSMPELSTWLVPRLRDEIAVLHADAIPAVDYLYLNLGGFHPVFAYLAPFLPFKQPSYAWYIRVPDPAGFVMLIAPALVRRIAAGALAGLTQTLTLDFYQNGLRMEFEEGRLTAAENLAAGHAGDASFPPLVFLQLLFGYRTAASLSRVYPDVRLGQSGPLLEALFPRRRSCVRPLM